MFADALLGTHNGTGGAGALTLVRAKGCALPSDLPGLSGTIAVPYQASEYTDATWGTLLQYERGTASLNLATGVLSSRVPSYTITAGGVILTGSPAALNFGNTAANFAIRFGDSAVTQRPALPAMNSYAGINEPYATFNTRQQIAGGGAIAIPAGGQVWIPSEYAYAKPITIAGIYTTTTVAANVRMAVYEWAPTGMAGNLVKEFTAAAQIVVGTAAGVKTFTLATPFWLPPGWYYLWIQSDAAISVYGSPVYGAQGAGSINQREVMWFSKSGTYGPAPAVADMTGLTVATTSSFTGQPVGYIK